MGYVIENSKKTTRGVFAWIPWRTFFTGLALACLIFSTSATSAFANSRYASIVIDANSGDVLYSRNAESYRYPASLTKMMTLYMTFEALESGKIKSDQKLKVSKRAAGQAPSKLWLKAGETITVEQAIKALVTRSANDAATVLAEAIGGTEYQFSLQMSKKARGLGMRRTNFANASGLPNRKQKSTAHDMAILGQQIGDDFPQYFHYFSVKSFAYKGKTYSNHNNLLKGYQGTDGIKTGYTRASGFNLATSVKRGDVHLIGVVLGGKTAKSRDAHMKYILDKTFKRVKDNPGLLPRLAKAPVPRLKPGQAQPTRLAQVTPRDKPKLVIERNGDGLPTIAFGYDTTTTVEIDELPTIEQGDAGPQALDPQWGIQIGAFAQAEKARIYLGQAHEIIPQVLTPERSNIFPVTTDQGTIYRARYGPLSSQDAETACISLRSKGLSCFTLQGAGWSQS